MLDQPNETPKVPTGVGRDQFYYWKLIILAAIAIIAAIGMLVSSGTPPAAP